MVKAPASHANNRRFESYREPITLGKSCESSTMSNDRLERTIAGSRAPLVLNYSRFVVLGSGPAKLGSPETSPMSTISRVMAYWQLT